MNLMLKKEETDKDDADVEADPEPAQPEVLKRQRAKSLSSLVFQAKK